MAIVEASDAFWVRAVSVVALLVGMAGVGFGEEPQGVEIFDAQTGEVALMEPVRRSEDEWRKQLTPEQYHVTREKGTERPFTGAYLNHKERGLYQCVACGTDLFRSETKYDSGTGWPSFWTPIDDHNVRLEEDRSLFMRRVEVICSRCGAHLGHVFEDGPPPTGQRFCINSAALRFSQNDTEATRED